MPDNILLGVAWPYANGSLHLGQIAGAYLPADIFARYQRAAGNRVLMVSGSDQHGTPITVRADQDVVTAGPYAHVRHPLYLAILLLTLGTVLAHPSAATACIALGLATGVAIKIPMEERALRATLGERYARYAARVPALVPRLGR